MLLGTVFCVISAALLIVLMPFVFEDPKSRNTKLCVALLFIFLSLAVLSMLSALS